MEGKKIPIGINSMCVAYSRPKNLVNIFMYSKVDCLDGTSFSSYMEFRLEADSFLESIWDLLDYNANERRHALSPLIFI